MSLVSVVLSVGLSPHHLVRTSFPQAMFTQHGVNRIHVKMAPYKKRKLVMLWFLAPPDYGAGENP